MSSSGRPRRAASLLAANRLSDAAASTTDTAPATAPEPRKKKRSSAERKTSATKSGAGASAEKSPKKRAKTEHAELNKTKSAPALMRRTSSVILPPWKPSPVDFTQPPLASSDTIKIVSFNCASYRAILGKGLKEYVDGEKPDIVCVGETKVDQAFMEANHLHTYHWHLADATTLKGQAGVATFSKEKPLRWINGIGDPGHDGEGRCVTAEFEKFFLVNTYVPNAGAALKRMDNRMDWDKKLTAFLKELDEKKPVVWCGDLNVALEEIDLTNPSTNTKNAGFTPEERESFRTIIKECNLIDTYRDRYPEEKDCYTFWSYRHNSRAKNIGWRLDYFLVSKRILGAVEETYRRPTVGGSDHCPIVLHLGKIE